MLGTITEFRMKYIILFVCLVFELILRIECQDLSVRCIPPIQDRYRAVNGGEISASCTGQGNPKPTISWYSINNLIGPTENKDTVSIEFSYVNSELFFCIARNKHGIERCYLGAYFESYSRLYEIILQFQNTSHAYNLSLNNYGNIQCSLNSLSIEFIARESEVLLSLLIVQKREITDLSTLINYIHIFYEFMCVVNQNSTNYIIYNPYFGDNIHQSGKIISEITTEIISENDTDFKEIFVYLFTSLVYLENNMNISLGEGNRNVLTDFSLKEGIFTTSPTLPTTPQLPITSTPTAHTLIQTVNDLFNNINSSLDNEESIENTSIQFQNITNQIDQTLAQNEELTNKIIKIATDILNAIKSLNIVQQYHSSSNKIPPTLLRMLLSLESFVGKKIQGLQHNTNSIQIKTNIIHISILYVNTEFNTGPVITPDITGISNPWSPTATIPYSILNRITLENNASSLYISTITYNINVYFVNDAQTTRFLSLNFDLQQRTDNNFADAINITFTHNIDDVIHARCIFFASENRMNTTGLKLVSYDNQSIVCSTNHATTFAAIVSFNKPNNDRTKYLALKFVSFILLSFSFFALSVSIILFCLAGKTFFLSLPNLIYFNYAIALLLGCACFLFLLPTAVLNEYYCVVAVFITQYVWSAVFTWSFCVSVMLIYFFRVDKVIEVRNIKPFIGYCAFGWGVPIFPCTITLFVTTPNFTDYIHYESMRNNATCYLSNEPERYTTWGLLGTVLILLSLEVLVLIYLSLLLCCRTNHELKNCCQFKHKQSKENTFRIKFRNLYIGFIIIMSILGLPWLLLVVNAVCSYIIGNDTLSSIMEWLFLVLNAPIGVVFFFAYTIHSKEVKGLFNHNIFTTENIASSPTRKTSPSRQSFPLPDSIPRAKKPLISSLSSTLGSPIPQDDNAFENPVFSISQ